MPIGDCQLKCDLLEVRGNLIRRLHSKLALCVSFYLTSQTLSLCEVGQQSLFNFQRPKTSFDQVSKLQRSIGVIERSTFDAYTQTPQIESRLQSAVGNRQSTLPWWR